MTALAVALALLLAGGVLAFVASPWPRVSAACAVLGAVVGGAVGVAVAARALVEDGPSFSWLTSYGQVRVAIDPLSAFFLVPIFGLSALTAVFGHGYFASLAKRRRGVTWFAFNLLAASMVCVVVARQAVFFLVAWEVMSVCSYLLITFDHEDVEVRRAGWVYLIAAHVGAACLFAMFLLFASHSGSFNFDAIGSVPKGVGIALFVLAVFGFGVKAGIVPLHVWLPEAHAAAPSHVSALMSGIVIKMGIYGLLRALLLIGHPAVWWGPVLVLLGIGSATLGIALALYQRDLKRVLAYSSVENVGIVLIGLGTGFWGMTSGRPYVAVLGVTGALLHVWNHALMKCLLFLSAGSVVHGSGTKDLERLGGLMKRMPITARAMTVGAVAIAALPPLNGFVSEWLIYLGLAHGAVSSTGATSVAAALVIGVVALVGALTVLCFVRLIGISLLGEPRSSSAEHAHEHSRRMMGVLVLLAVLCVGAALAPQLLVRASARVVERIVGPHESATLPIAMMGSINALLLAVVGLGTLGVHRLTRDSARDSTWGCGYARPTARMQYTSRSFTEIAAADLLPAPIRPRIAIERPATLFPRHASLHSEYTDPVTRGVYEPFLVRWGDRFARLRWFQQGVLHAYIFYILVAALGLLAWVSLRSWTER